MSLDKRWVEKPTPPDKIDALQNSLNIHPMLCKMLVDRGIETFDEAKTFFRPSLDKDIHDPLLMKDMLKAVERVDLAMRNGEKILFYGDYDVDGTMCVSLMYSFFSKYYDQIDYYIPDRYKEGYGLSIQGIDYAAQKGISLIICMDCGIRAFKSIAAANELDIDVIVCDHHLPEDHLPPAHAVLDPKRDDCMYPFKELSGCGVAFKLAQALTEYKGWDEEYLFSFLDLLTISICCDIVAMEGENRALAYHGMKQIDTSPNLGLRTLMNVNEVQTPITCSRIVFGIGPLINAAGRLKDAKLAVKLMLAENQAIANEYAHQLVDLNKERQSFDREIFEEAQEIIDASKSETDAIVLYNKKWNKGVIGIAAARVVEKYYKPTIIFTYSNGNITGSARSIRGFNIHDAIHKCEDLVINFGGHKYAAGLTLSEENLSKFIKKFQQVVSEDIKEIDKRPELIVDGILPFQDITSKLHNIIKQFEPFGPKNRSPVFLNNEIVDKSIRVLKEKHLKFSFPVKNNTLDGIAFFQGDKYDKAVDNPIDICYSIEENTWRGNTRLQLNIKGIRVKS